MNRTNMSANIVERLLANVRQNGWQNARAAGLHLAAIARKNNEYESFIKQSNRIIDISSDKKTLCLQPIRRFTVSKRFNSSEALFWSMYYMNQASSRKKRQQIAKVAFRKKHYTDLVAAEDDVHRAHPTERR